MYRISPYNEGNLGCEVPLNKGRACVRDTKIKESGFLVKVGMYLLRIDNLLSTLKNYRKRATELD